jgi:hypothetical protein
VIIGPARRFSLARAALRAKPLPSHKRSPMRPSRPIRAAQPAATPKRLRRAAVFGCSPEGER